MPEAAPLSPDLSTVDGSQAELSTLTIGTSISSTDVKVEYLDKFSGEYQEYQGLMRLRLRI